MLGLRWVENAGFEVGEECREVGDECWFFPGAVIYNGTCISRSSDIKCHMYFQDR